MDELTRLLIAARDGDRWALASAIRASQSEVWRLAAHLVGAEDADDVTQDTYMRMWRALPAFRGDSSARTWLLAIARRACADAIRAHARRRRLRISAERSMGLDDNLAESAGEGHAVRDLVAALEPDRRDAFVLTQVVGCSYTEAAEICGVPLGTIRSRVARARADLIAGLAAAEAG